MLPGDAFWHTYGTRPRKLLLRIGILHTVNPQVPGSSPGRGAKSKQRVATAAHPAFERSSRPDSIQAAECKTFSDVTVASFGPTRRADSKRRTRARQACHFAALKTASPIHRAVP